MRSLWTIIGLGAVASSALAAAHCHGTARATQPGGASLLGTLAEWNYPGSKLLDGANMRDGGNPRVPSVLCRAVLTTPDAFEKVTAFYAEKVGTSQPPGQKEAKAGAGEADGKSVSAQDDSGGRPVKLRVIVVNRADAATTLVISRAEAESETHIAWSHYMRLGARP